MRIAIIGAGVSGLIAADRLARRHEVTLFEANRNLGGHANTVDVQLDGQRHSIDTGFVVFNRRTYPRFCALLDELGVRSLPTSMSFSVSCETTGLEYNGTSLAGVFAQRRNLFRPNFHRMLRDILRFNRQAPRLLHVDPRDAGPTVGEFLRDGRYGQEFARQYLLPMGSAIWSCPMDAFERFPMRFIVEFYQNHGLLSLANRPTWQVIEGGSRVYVAALAARFGGRLCIGKPIERVRRLADRVEVKPRDAAPESFEHVVFACHSDQALRMLADPTSLEREVLSAFPYERNVAVLHTDTSLLPRTRRAWASWNYRLRSDSRARATVTYCMNTLQQLQARQVLCVSLNAEERIDPAKILQRFVYHHPVFTLSRAAAQARHRELINVNRTSYCGAYWRNGFHEDGVVSALTVCEAIERDQSHAEDRRASAAHELLAAPSESECHA